MNRPNYTAVLALAALVGLDCPAFGQFFSPATQADSANFTLNTTATTENGGQVTSDSANFALNTTGARAIQADSGDFIVDTRLSLSTFALFSPLALPGGLFQFSFSNAPGASFRVFGTTNVAMQFSNWMLLGTVTDQPPGYYQFTDAQMTNYPRRFYRATSP